MIFKGREGHPHPHWGCHGAGTAGSRLQAARQQLSPCILPSFLGTVTFLADDVTYKVFKNTFSSSLHCLFVSLSFPFVLVSVLPASCGRGQFPQQRAPHSAVTVAAAGRDWGPCWAIWVRLILFSEGASHSPSAGSQSPWPRLDRASGSQTAASGPPPGGGSEAGQSSGCSQAG